MNKKLLSIFFLFFLIFILGCIESKEKEEKKEEEEGVIYATLLINGRETDTLSLISNQKAEIGIKIKNNGEGTLHNLTGGIYGCLQADWTEPEDLFPYSSLYLSWSVEAPSLGRNERLSCPTTIRLCFDYTTRGYSDLVLIPEKYTKIPPSPNTFSFGDFLSLNFDFGVTRTIGGRSKIIGRLTITNIGDGWVDYTSYENNLEMNMLKKIKLSVSESVEIIDYGNVGNISEWTDESRRVLEINPGNAGNYTFLLKLIQGREIYSDVELNVTKDITNLTIEKIEVDVEYGYCIDIATIKTQLIGR